MRPSFQKAISITGTCGHIQFYDEFWVFCHFLENPLIHLQTTVKITGLVSMAASGSDPLFSPARYKNKEICLICSDELKKKDIGNSLRIIGWRKLKENAQKWSNIDIPFSDSIGNDDSAGPSPRIFRDTANPPFVNHKGNDVKHEG